MTNFLQTTKKTSLHKKTILPDIYAFFETEEGNHQYEEWLKEEEAKNIKNGKTNRTGKC